jgi:hypothetical protein
LDTLDVFSLLLASCHHIVAVNRATKQQPRTEAANTIQVFRRFCDERATTKNRDVMVQDA